MKQYPIYISILHPISQYIDCHSQYIEILFYFNNDIITAKIVNDGIVENHIDNPMSLSSFYDFCHIVQDIVVFITID